MLSIDEIRRANLLLLVRSFATVEALSRAVNVDATYLVNIKNGVRRMGYKVARRIEHELQFHKGVMDTPNLGAKVPRSVGAQVSRDTLVGDLQRLYQIDKSWAEKGMALLDVLFKDEPKVKKSKKRAGR